MCVCGWWSSRRPCSDSLITWSRKKLRAFLFREAIFAWFWEAIFHNFTAAAERVCYAAATMGWRYNITDISSMLHSRAKIGEELFSYGEKKVYSVERTEKKAGKVRAVESLNCYHDWFILMAFLRSTRCILMLFYCWQSFSSLFSLSPPCIV